MRASVQSAALALLDQIKAPGGTVNTQVGSDTRGKFIRVFVDPMYWLSVSNIPKKFRGYRVVVERRELTYASGY